MPVQRDALVLASGSPRRREILSQLGLVFRVIESGVDEGPPDGRAPEAYALALAAEKVSAVVSGLSAQATRAFVLGADTIVVVDAQILGKPCDTTDALRMLLTLQGRTHEVITAVALGRVGDAPVRVVAVHSQVTFRALDELAAERYVAAGEGRDKAGGYGIQGLGAGLVRAIEGSYSNVVGLPACETLELLMEGGALCAWP